MEREAFKIVFMGTPDFAVATLKTLQENRFNIVGVVTVPDKPAGRGQQIQESAVKKYASSQHLNILQPVSLKDPLFVEQLQQLEADLFVVVAFRMLPEIVWAMPPKGTINLHGSLLPKYRGAAPINWAIINGDSETGVTTFFIEKEIDTGKVIDQEKVAIGNNDNVGKIHDALMEIGASLMLKTVDQIKDGTAKAIPQDDFKNSLISHAPKIFKETTRINFSQNALAVHNFVRGLDPYPGAWCLLKNKKTGEQKTFKLFESSVSEIKSDLDAPFGSSKEGLLIPTQDFYLNIKEIQMEGKRRMDHKAFLAGNTIEDWEILK